jgi:hypothetical protein
MTSRINANAFFDCPACQVQEENPVNTIIKGGFGLYSSQGKKAYFKNLKYTTSICHHVANIIIPTKNVDNWEVLSFHATSQTGAPSALMVREVCMIHVGGLCTFQYRQQSEHSCSDHCEGCMYTNMYFCMLVGCVNTTTSRINTNAFFDVTDVQVATTTGFLSNNHFKCTNHDPSQNVGAGTAWYVPSFLYMLYSL